MNKIFFLILLVIGLQLNSFATSFLHNLTIQVPLNNKKSIDLSSNFSKINVLRTDDGDGEGGSDDNGDDECNSDANSSNCYSDFSSCIGDANKTLGSSASCNCEAQYAYEKISNPAQWQADIMSCYQSCNNSPAMGGWAMDALWCAAKFLACSARASCNWGW